MRLATIILGVLLLAGLCPARAAAGSCGGVADSCPCGGNNPYPCCNNGGGKTGNCTWGAWHKACCAWGKKLPGWGNAGMWAGNAASHPDYEVHSSPVVNSIAVKVTSSSGYGHVAWVTKVSGGNVTVTQQSCCSVSSCFPNCSWCINGFYSSSHSAGTFNGGYITPKGAVWVCQPGQVQTKDCGNCGAKKRTCKSNGQWGNWGGCSGQGVCAPGAGQSENCGDCGQHSRKCKNNCSWGSWGACAGPDPDNGDAPCLAPEPGVCAEGRLRCQEGFEKCVPVLEPSVELCDGLDNDCDGATDNGSPTEFGETAPQFAGQLEDLSFPHVMFPGQSSKAWVDFLNVGSEPWPHGQIWLRVVSAEEGCPLAPPGEWPAWDVAALLTDDVSAGDCGRFEVPLQAPGVPGLYQLHFALQTPEGKPMLCPEPEMQIAIKVGLDSASSQAVETAVMDAAAETSGPKPDLSGSAGDSQPTGSGCGAHRLAPVGGSVLALLLLLSLLGLAHRIVIRCRR